MSFSNNNWVARIAGLVQMPALSLALIMVWGSSLAIAQSAACLRLQNQLSAITSGGSDFVQPSPRYRQYDRAVKDQRAQISKTQRMAQRNGCRNLFGTRKSPRCARIFQSLDQMSSNLASLEQERRRLAPRRSRNSENQRRNIINAMNQRRCLVNAPAQQFARAQPRTRSLVEQIFGVRTFSNDGTRGIFERPNASFSSRYNTYRTMCVRKQDGYYFPVSFSTTPDRFEFDERVCQSKCPNADVALYYHAMPAQDSEDMVSFRGQEPYADLTNAFAYRKKFDPKATCRYSSGLFLEVAGSNGERDRPTNQSDSVLSRVAKPTLRQHPSFDPETLANLQGKFGKKQIAKLLDKSIDPLELPNKVAANKNVRVVGPAFYPVQ